MSGLDRRLSAVADAAGPPAGIAVAVRAPGGDATLCRGTTDRRGGAPVTERTRFEVGSVSKTFTALLLAEMAERGDVALDDPAGTRGHRVTLEHLATHTSGLPRLPPGLLRTAWRSWYTNPYGHYPPERLLPALARTRVRREPGTRVHYSNFGVGLLGRLLAEEAGTDYGTLLTARVLDPLGLRDTTADRSLPQAVGHRHGRPLPPWDIPALPGAGAVRSSAADLLRYLAALTGPDAAVPGGGPLRAALREVVRPRVTGPGGPALPLAWSTRERPGHVLYHHSGGTRGSTAFAGFCPEHGVHVVALAATGPTVRGRFIQSAYLLLRSLAAEAAERTGERG
ncbi:serine hydrolase domain-containing protein [Streptomyces marincola]|uniref:serine hydrolase domain-containing protein n=1 Tax=Streptomyces marincola TaxID=2878388 RepID=UPI001CF57759|nr:serine hydrolase domain-containing protein [Streptomyces marincola]UCM90424.1 beta-lactamase family protein [Streptomyces marincola]